MSFYESTDNRILDNLNRTQDETLGYAAEVSDQQISMSRLENTISEKLALCTDMVECESTWVDSQQDCIKMDNGSHEGRKQFDIIAMKVNKTIQDINTIYNEIGYSAAEVSLKKADIFLAIEDTISTFTFNLRREKNNIENECEWLRQQIKIILAMVDDQSGEKNLTLLERGIVFCNRVLFEQGYKDEVIANSIRRDRDSSFYSSSPFNISDEMMSESPATFDDSPVEHQIKHIPHYSLLRTKSNLNIIFLRVLKVFVKIFRQIIELTVNYWELMDITGKFSPHNAETDFYNSLPSREDTYKYRSLMQQFETCIKVLRLSNTKTKIQHPRDFQREEDEDIFVNSSPKKQFDIQNRTCLASDIDIDTSGKSMGSAQKMEEVRAYLRDLNYNLVKIIRNLKFTKLTPDLLSMIQREVNEYELDVNNRTEKVRSIIQKCLELIETLNLSEEQIINIQRQYDASKNTKKSESYLDIETLTFISNNPKEFGLNDKHLDFLRRISDALQKLKDSKQRKMDYYSGSCEDLWEKLNEDSEYVEHFKAANSALTDTSIMNFKMELNRLLVKRTEYIDEFIFEARQEITRLWDALYYTELQRSTFKFHDITRFSQEQDKESMLKEHELILKELKNEYSEKCQILSMYAQLNELRNDQVFLKESSKDSSRLLSKNSCKILLNEEKIRKKIHKNLPKLIYKLKEQTTMYNNEQFSMGKKPFLINGEDFFEQILLIESEQYNLGYLRNLKTKSHKDSPTKRGINERNSPSKSKGLAFPLKARNMNETRILNDRTEYVSPENLRRSLSYFSPQKSFAGKRSTFKPLPKKRTNTIKRSKTVRALNSAMSSQNESTSTVSLESPLKSSQNKMATLKYFGSQLPPLNSPLKEPIHDESIVSEASSDFRLSPLNLNSIFNIQQHHSHSNGKVKGDKQSVILLPDYEGVNKGPIAACPSTVMEEEKENLSYIDRKQRNSCYNEADSSTIIGDEYQLWREERIRQLNKYI